MFKNNFSIIFMIKIRIFFLSVRFIEIFFFLSFTSVLIELIISFINILNYFVKNSLIRYVLNETFFILITSFNSFNI